MPRPVNATTRKKVNEYKKKGFEKVYTMANFRNVQSELNKAVNEERVRLGIPPEVRAASPPPQQDPPRAMTPTEKRNFEASLLKILEENTENTASDPGTPRSRGGRRRITRRKQRGCRFARRH